jgi:hypothetical protein
MRDCKLGRLNDSKSSAILAYIPSQEDLDCMSNRVHIYSPLDLTLATSQGNLTYKRL